MKPKLSWILPWILINLLAFTTVKAQYQQNVQQFSVDIPMPVYVMQEQTYWCWAACNAMLLNTIGIAESQQNQVVKLFGQLINYGAGPNFERSKLALAGTYINQYNQQVTIVPYVSYLTQQRSDDPKVIIDHISQGIPVVMATPMHGKVCVGIDYITDGSFYQITRMKLYNPANPNSVETVSIQEYLSEGLIGFMTFDLR